jgi:hypothetical protein
MRMRTNSTPTATSTNRLNGAVEQELQDDRDAAEFRRHRQQVDELAGHEGEEARAKPSRSRMTSNTGRRVTAATRPQASA